jgi:hypothetical protein
MSWDNIQETDKGWVGKLTCKQDGTAVDISSYTTLQYILTDPDGTATTKTAAFDSDGTDGKLKYTIITGDISGAGDWRVQARIAKTDVEITSDPLEFSVQARLD